MAALRRRKKEIAVEARSGQLVNRDKASDEERSPFAWELEEKWAEAWRQARRADLR